MKTHKDVHVKRVWMDDENHFLKGYPVNELEYTEESQWHAFVRKIKEFFKKKV